MAPALKLVSSNDRAPEAPYDATIRAKGWKFTIDYERLLGSDTWDIAGVSGMQSDLLFLWLTAWMQAPAGSLPNDEEAIAAKIRMKLGDFRANRDVLMRGWWLADDGRLYHNVLIEQVLAMVSARRSEADKAATRRARDKQKQALEVKSTQVLPAGSTPVLPVLSDTGTGTGTDKCLKASAAADAASGSTNADASPTPAAPPAAEKGRQVDLLPPDPALPGDPPSGVVPARRKREPKEIPDCPHAAIVAAWARVLPEAHQVAEWGSKRRGMLNARWEAKRNRQNVEWWENLFAFVGRSKFLTGRKPPNGDRKEPFLVSLDWLLNEENFARVLERRYHDPDEMEPKA